MTHTPSARVLVVEDDRTTADLVALYLRHEGYQVVVEHEGTKGMKRIENERFDLMLFDLMLPGVDGLALCRRAHELSQGGVILLTARTREDERLHGFAEGADDYVSKPFSPRELMARVGAVLRRCPPQARDILRVGPLEVDRIRHLASVHGTDVDLTPTEFGLLEDLLRYPGHVRTRAQLLRFLPDSGSQALERTVDVHVGNLRRKLNVVQDGPQLIETVPGVGYRVPADLPAQRAPNQASGPR